MPNNDFNFFNNNNQQQGGYNQQQPYNPYGYQPPQPPMPPQGYYQQPQQPATPVQPISEDTLPKEFKPIGAFGYVGLTILYFIPVIGWIILLVHCFSGANVVRRHYARSFFAWILIVILIAIIGFVLSLVMGDALTEMINGILDQIQVPLQ